MFNSQSARREGLSPAFPFFLSEVEDLGRAGGGLQGQSLFLLGTGCLLGEGCLQKRGFGERLGAGRMLNAVKAQLV